MRRETRISTLLAGVLLVTALPASADMVRGQQLYEHHCQLCHKSSAHVRDNHKVQNEDDLAYFVRRWSDYLKLDWTAEDRADVKEYLNDAYYKLEPAAEESETRKAPCEEREQAASTDQTGQKSVIGAVSETVDAL